ncbi:MAG: TIGR02147 family protein [Bdellovibrionota bacterium]|nr:MAG: TIGR02147 family protein [Pseudomonadota bacterium]
MAKLKLIAPSVTRFLDPIEYLEALFKSVKGQEKSYSYLEFAEDLGFSRTNIVHLILRGKRPLSIKSGEKIAEILAWKGLERRYWLNLVAYHDSTDENERDHLMSEIVEIKGREVSAVPHLKDQLEFFTEWYHAILFEFANLASFTEDPKTLGAMLEPRIRPEQAKRSLALLETLGFLVRVDGKLRPVVSNLSTGDEIASLSVVRYHQNMIDLGKRSLTAIDSDQRDISSISFACPESLVPELKRAISGFRKQILALADQCSDKDLVYQLNLQLFPVTRHKG